MPQPIDPNTEIMRMNAAERIQQIMDRVSLTAQAHQRSEAGEKLVAMESYVQHLAQKDEALDEELRRRNPYRGRRAPKSPQKHGSEAAHVFYSMTEGRKVVEDPDDHELDIDV